MGDLYKRFSRGETNNDIFLINIDTILKLENLWYMLNRQYYELIGYWTAKMEERRKNLKGVLRHQEKKEKRFQNFRELLSRNQRVDLSEMNREERRRFIPRAMESLGVTERTILNYFKDIRKPSPMHPDKK